MAYTVVGVLVFFIRISQPDNKLVLHILSIAKYILLSYESYIIGRLGNIRSGFGGGGYSFFNPEFFNAAVFSQRRQHGAEF